MSKENLKEILEFAEAIKYDEIALEAFQVREDCDGNECGGVGPIIDKVSATKVIPTEHSVQVYVSYCYKSLCGLSDRVYHVATSLLKCVYEFKDGRLTRDNEDIFNEPWLESTWLAYEGFFKKYSEVIPVSAAEFFEKKIKHDEAITAKEKAIALSKN